MDSTYNSQALAEVFYIITLLEKEKFDKIPTNVIDAIKSNMDQEYDVDINNLIENSKISEETTEILSVIYLKYLANQNEKGIIYELINYEKKKNIKEWPKKDIKNNVKIENQIILRKEGLFRRILNKIRYLLDKE